MGRTKPQVGRTKPQMGGTELQMGGTKAGGSTQMGGIEPALRRNE